MVNKVDIGSSWKKKSGVTMNGVISDTRSVSWEYNGDYGYYPPQPKEPIFHQDSNIVVIGASGDKVTFLSAVNYEETDDINKTKIDYGSTKVSIGKITTRQQKLKLYEVTVEEFLRCMDIIV